MADIVNYVKAAVPPEPSKFFMVIDQRTGMWPRDAAGRLLYFVMVNPYLGIADALDNDALRLGRREITRIDGRYTIHRNLDTTAAEAFTAATGLLV